MEDKSFEIDDVTYTVSVSHFTPPTPGVYHALPEDCYPDEPAEVEFEDKVEYARDGANEVSTMAWCDFLMIYATEHTKGDVEKAEEDIGDITIHDIMIQAGEYEPE